MKDQVIVITGGSAGIGAALAELVSKKGAKVALVARREDKLKEVASRCGENALTIVGDVTRRADVERAIASTLERFGHIDVWVNNAGRGISRPVSQLTDEDMDDMWLVNVKSAVYGMQAVLPHFKEQKRGHIINISSLLGRVPFASIRSVYSACKHALNSLTANLRMELRAEYPDIQVSSVHPGVVATEFGVSARHGGMDSRKFPGAQTAEEVAAVIAETIETRKADVYTRPGAREMIARYYAHEDMGQAEQEPPFNFAAPK
jgi:NADP-dependent 3-hydroxy acid dehydrogenase YdfG